jgi:hypothetical protein
VLNYGQVGEEGDGLFGTMLAICASCVFARQVWAGLLQPVGLLHLMPQPTDEVFEDWWCASSPRVQQQLKQGFNSSHSRRAGYGSIETLVFSMERRLVCKLPSI